MSDIMGPSLDSIKQIVLKGYQKKTPIVLVFWYLRHDKTIQTLPGGVTTK